MIKAVEEIMIQPGLMFYCGVSALTILVYNVVGLLLIKRVSSVFKAFWGSLSVLPIWVISN